MGNTAGVPKEDGGTELKQPLNLSVNGGATAPTDMKIMRAGTPYSFLDDFSETTSKTTGSFVDISTKELSEVNLLTRNEFSKI
jgi:hypothetical protein